MTEERKKIVFVCVQNASRSQMAQGFAEAFGKGRVEVYSAGSRPSSETDLWFKRKYFPYAVETPIGVYHVSSKPCRIELADQLNSTLLHFQKYIFYLVGL